MRRRMLLILVCAAVAIGLSDYIHIHEWVFPVMVLFVSALYAYRAANGLRRGFFPSGEDTATEIERSLSEYRAPGYYRDTQPSKFWRAFALRVAFVMLGGFTGITGLLKLW